MTAAASTHSTLMIMPTSPDPGGVPPSVADANAGMPNLRQLLAHLGDQLPDVDDVAPAAARDLVERVRDLVDAVVLTDVDAPERATVAREIDALIARLTAATRDPGALLARLPTGDWENLSNAGSGALNPQALRLQWVDTPPMARPGADIVGLEVRARCTLTEAHGGAHRRAHGGIVALILDQVTGRAAHFAGAGGLTAHLEVDFRRATPLGVPLEITARWTGRDGRKSYAEAEIHAGGVLTAQGRALMVVDSAPDAAE